MNKVDGKIFRVLGKTDIKAGLYMGTEFVQNIESEKYPKFGIEIFK